MRAWPIIMACISMSLDGTGVQALRDTVGPGAARAERQPGSADIVTRVDDELRVALTGARATARAPDAASAPDPGAPRLRALLDGFEAWLTRVGGLERALFRFHAERGPRALEELAALLGVPRRRVTAALATAHPRALEARLQTLTGPLGDPALAIPLATAACSAFLDDIAAAIVSEHPTVQQAERALALLDSTPHAVDTLQTLRQLRAELQPLITRGGPLPLQSMTPRDALARLTRSAQALPYSRLLGAPLSEPGLGLERRMRSALERATQRSPLLQLSGDALEPTPAALDINRILEAFFALRIMDAALAQDCAVPQGVDFVWNPGAVGRVATRLEQALPLMRRVRSAARTDDAIRDSVVGALGNALCEQLERLSCDDLRQLRRPPPQAASPLERLRLRAASLRESTPSLKRLLASSSSLDCRHGGLAANLPHDFAVDLLEKAAEMLAVIGAEALATLASRSDAVKLRDVPEGREVASELHAAQRVQWLHRQVAALTLSIAEPALEVATSERPGLAAEWFAVLQDLEAPSEDGGASGRSGLYAFESLYGLLEARREALCESVPPPWFAPTFDSKTGLFFEAGRRLVDAVALRCATGPSIP